MRGVQLSCLAKPSGLRGCDVSNRADDKKIVDGHQNAADEDKPAITLPGVVEKVVKPIHKDQPEKAQILVHGADDLYKEIRIENTLEDAAGETVKLKPGAEVEVTIEASKDDVEKKSD
jgi:hypothetical protein